MTRQGCNCVPVGCKGGGCGFCKVVVLSGEYECGKMSKLHAPPEAIQQGKVLACRIYPLTDLVIEHRAEPGD
ncbi:MULTISPECIES: 2Fe-2S iron-sulfur cluster-binding protein [unclassified Marinobacter]|uniref:2Fe-2S iron-sulfur cluster-binding protein n=1 Tax=Marinobacter sp. AL4B TaxID=2871173 RepID=UPI002934B68B|nr:MULTISPECIES: 2Fe-2S iron-sulfur cluster-binding protein [unclassified Marinobacter]